MAPQGAAHQLLPAAPDTVLPVQFALRAPPGQPGRDATQGAQLAVQAPGQEHRLQSLGAQAGMDPRHPPGLAGQGGVDQLEEIEAGAVADAAQYLLGARLAPLQQQGQQLQLLSRGQQVALDPLGDQGAGGGIELQSQGRGPLADPARQPLRRHRPDLYHGAGLLEGPAPGAAEGLAVQLRAGDQQQVVRRRVLGPGLQGGPPLPSRLALAQPQFHQTAAGEQRHHLPLLLQSAPVEGCIDRQYAALLVALLPGRLAHRVGTLQQLQRFVAGDQPDRRQLSTGQEGGKTRRVKPHQRCRARRTMRRTAWADSRRISRCSCDSSAFLPSTAVSSNR